MNIILTNFGIPEQSSIKSGFNRVNKIFNSSEQSIKDGQKKVDGASQKGEIREDRKNKTPPTPHRNNPQNRNNPLSQNQGSPQGSLPQQPQGGPLIPAIKKDVSTPTENVTVSQNSNYVSFRNNDPRFTLDTLNLDSVIADIDHSIPVGEIKSDDRVQSFIEEPSNSSYAKLSNNRKYNTTLDITSSNANDPRMMAALGGVWQPNRKIV